MPDYFVNAPLKDSSKAFYNSRLTTLANAARTSNFAALFQNPHTTIATIRNYLKSTGHDTVSGLHGFLKSLLAYRRYHPDEFQNTDELYLQWMTIFTRLYNQYTEYRQNNEPSPTQQNKSGHSMTLEEINQYRDGLPDTEPVKLLIAMYTMIPPMRADYGEVEVLDFESIPTAQNYILLSPSRAIMVINDYKTAATNGPVRQVLPDTLRMLIARSIARNPRRYLFQTSRGTAYSRARYSQWANKQLTDLFDREFTVTLFRHIYINSLRPDEMTVLERRRIAHLMGHNQEQQDLYRWVA